MNRKGFTLIELLATLVVLGIIAGITLVSVNGGFGNAKDNTEDVFVDTIKDAMEIYLDSDGKNLNFGNSSVCTINKTHGKVNLYKTNINFQSVIDSKYHPITQKDLVNPANKDVSCNNASNIFVSVYRDDDYVYYYKIDKGSFNCLKKSDSITNLPSECVEA